MAKTIKYALREKASRKLLGYTLSSNAEGDFCVENQYCLYAGDEKVWQVDEAWQAEYVRQNSTEWYNAGYETPTHDYEPEELEVVEVTTVVDEKLVEVKIPTNEEYWNWKYGSGGPSEDLKHLKFLLGLDKANKANDPGVYNIGEYFRVQEKNRGE